MIYRIADNITSPIGETTEENYRAVKAGKSALCRYEHRWGLPEPFCASLFDEAQNRSMATDGLTRFESLALASARKAVQEAKIDASADNVVFILSTTKGNIELIFDEQAADADIYPGTAARHIAERIGVTTTPLTVCNACISGVSAIVLAQRLLEAGRFDYAIVCGADTQNKFTVSGFQSLKAVSEAPCGPFDLERLGLNLGEAAATIVFARKAEGKQWAVESGAVRNDAFHISSPSKNGEGATLALAAAAGATDTSRLAFVNAHGTATMFNDQMESVAIGRAGLAHVPVNAYKGYYGHTLGAAGVLETVLSMAAADDHTVLATKGFGELGVSGKVMLSAQHLATDKESFVKMISGFGHTGDKTRHGAGEDATEHDHQPPRETDPDGSRRRRQAAGLQRYRGAAADRDLQALRGRLSEILQDGRAEPPGLRGLGMLLKAEGERSGCATDDRAVILFNRSSSIVADRKYCESIIHEEDFFPSPAAFVYTLPNIVTGEIAMRNQYHGETSFYMTDRRDNVLMEQVLRASLDGQGTKSIIGGWVDYQDDSHFEADIAIYEPTSK